jgi:hypothetical protein
MELKREPELLITADLIRAIRELPVERDVTHCGQTFQVSPFEIYAECPQCRKLLKLRSFSAVPELEDLFDAVFEWMSQPGAEEVARRRRESIAADE